MTGIVGEKKIHDIHLKCFGRNPRLSNQRPHRPKSSQEKQNCDGRVPPLKYTASFANSKSRYGDRCKYGAQVFATKHRRTPGAEASFARNLLRQGVLRAHSRRFHQG